MLFLGQCRDEGQCCQSSSASASTSGICGACCSPLISSTLIARLLNNPDDVECDECVRDAYVCLEQVLFDEEFKCTWEGESLVCRPPATCQCEYPDMCVYMKMECLFNTCFDMSLTVRVSCNNDAIIFIDTKTPLRCQCTPFCGFYTAFAGRQCCNGLPIGVFDVEVCEVQESSCGNLACS